MPICNLLAGSPRHGLSPGTGAGVPFPDFLAFTSVFYFINLTNSRHWVKGARARAINNTTTTSAFTTARARATGNGTTTTTIPGPAA